MTNTHVYQSQNNSIQIPYSVSFPYRLHSETIVALVCNSVISNILQIF